jgi:PAS domain S-box-containing protein
MADRKRKQHFAHIHSPDASGSTDNLNPAIKEKALVKMLQEKNATLDNQNIELTDKLDTLTDHHQKHKLFFDDLPVPLLLITKTGLIHQYNHQAALLFDLPSQSQKKHAIVGFIQKDSKESFKRLIEAATKSQSIQSCEIVFLLKNKTVVFAKINAVGFFDHDGNEHLYKLVITDFTREKKRYGEQLLASESRYKELAENINEGIYLTEHSFITMVNKPMLNIFGYESDEVIGKKVWEFVIPERRVSIRKLFIKKVKESDTTPVEIECLRKNGTRFWAEIKISIFKDQRKIFGVLSNISDRKATEQALRESEEKYRSVVTAMNDGIILRDKYGKVLTWNRAAEKILNLKSDEVVNLLTIDHVRNAIHEDGTPFLPEMHPAMLTLKTGKPQHQVVMGIVDYKKKYKWITINAEPIYKNGEDTPSAVVTSVSDITNQKNTENKLREINAIKDKLFTIIAHDLKSPYNAQMAFLEMLMDEEVSYPPEQRNHIAKMLHDSARQSFALLDNLLLWSRTQTGRFPFKPAEISLKDVINEVMKIYQLTASLKQVELKVPEIKKNIKVNADYEMVNTVLRNLISNAIKFTPAGGVVEINCDAPDDEQIQVAVKDTGTGIQKKNLNLLFTAHEISSTPGTENEKGTGLGLIICKEFVERNGGKIWADSRQGQGSVFYFTLKNAAIQKKCNGTCMQHISGIYPLLKKNEKLRTELEHRIADLFREAFKSFNDESLQQFSAAVKELVKKYKVEPLRQFSNNFGIECRNRDQNQMNICFTEFEKLIDRVEREQQKKPGIKSKRNSS